MVEPISLVQLYPFGEIKARLLVPIGVAESAVPGWLWALPVNVCVWLGISLVVSVTVLAPPVFPTVSKSVSFASTQVITFPNKFGILNVSTPSPPYAVPIISNNSG